MSRIMQSRNPESSRSARVRNAVTATIFGMTLATTAQAQAAIGVPFVGRNHLSVSVTDLSRDGIGQDTKKVFGGVYGRRLGGDGGRVQYTAIVRTALRAVESNEGIVDAGVSLAATHRVMAGLSITGAAGVSAVVWGQDVNGNQPDRGRVIARMPVSAGAAYDIRLGAVTLAPFFTMTGAYSSERDYVNDERVNLYTGWRYGFSSGMSARFQDVVLTLTDINRERGMPKSDRMLFTAGISW
jgi:hypothetical protein